MSAWSSTCRQRVFKRHQNNQHFLTVLPCTRWRRKSAGIDRDVIEQGFTFHWTQNRSFRRCSSQPVLLAWYWINQTQQNETSLSPYVFSSYVVAWLCVVRRSIGAVVHRASRCCYARLHVPQTGERHSQCQTEIFNVAGIRELSRSPRRHSRVTGLC